MRRFAALRLCPVAGSIAGGRTAARGVRTGGRDHRGVVLRRQRGGADRRRAAPRHWIRRVRPAGRSARTGHRTQRPAQADGSPLRRTLVAARQGTGWPGARASTGSGGEQLRYPQGPAAARHIGYLELGYFADIDFDDPAEPTRKACVAALQLLAHAGEVLVDVRDNGGGSPAMVGYLSSAFVEHGSDIYNTFRWREGGASEAPPQEYPAPRTTMPLYVLTSGRTGSAAEAFAYTLGNAKRAVLVGERTGGAANPGRPFDIGGGFSVFVSTGSPVSPITGRNWEGTGVRPQVEVEASEAL